MKKVELEVSLDLLGNPKVVISDRKLSAAKRRIRWVKDKNDTQNWKFHRLDELNQVYFNKQSINEQRDRISCGNRLPTNDNNDYEYVIVVEYNGTKYNSTKTGPNPETKPVIRN